MDTAQLKKFYAESIAPALKEQFNYSSSMQIPVLKKIVINQGLGDATQDKKIIPATHTIIEQKSLGKALDAPIKQSDGTFLKPFEQAQRYASHLPYSERPRWIVSCNFSDFLVYDMEHPNAEPQHIALADLGKEYYRLAFLVDVADSHVQKELDLSRAAGTLVGKIYNALLPAYGAQPTAKDLQDLNKFIIRTCFPARTACRYCI